MTEEEMENDPLSAISWRACSSFICKQCGKVCEPKITLKEQFNSLVPVEFGGMQEPLLTNVEAMAEKFCIGFGKWLQSSNALNSGVPVNALLKMYKNQKGL